MKIYIAITWKALEYGQKLARQLEEAGHTVTSRFLAEDYVAPTEGEMDAVHARLDLLDIDEAEAMLQVTGNSRTYADGAYRGLDSTTGGRHVEFGYALAKKKPIFVLGQYESCFHTHGAICAVEDIQQFIKLLDAVTKLRAFPEASAAPARMPSPASSPEHGIYPTEGDQK